MTQETSNEKKTVIRWMAAWNDEREQRWLEEQERAGWRLSRIGFVGYVLEKAPAREMAYRLDFGPNAMADWNEYLGLYRDAGWEYVGRRGPWQFFRKPVAEGAAAPEIFTDVESRVGKYRRALTIAAVMLCVMLSQTVNNLAGHGPMGPHAGLFLGIQIAVTAAFVVTVVRLLLVIRRIRRRA